MAHLVVGGPYTRCFADASPAGCGFAHHLT